MYWWNNWRLLLRFVTALSKQLRTRTFIIGFYMTSQITLRIWHNREGQVHWQVVVGLYEVRHDDNRSGSIRDILSIDQHARKFSNIEQFISIDQNRTHLIDSDFFFVFLFIFINLSIIDIHSFIIYYPL